MERGGPLATDSVSASRSLSSWPLEVGYAVARGKWIIGYRGDFSRTGESPPGVLNLQVENFIRENGGEIVHILEALTVAVQRRAQRAGDRPH